MPSIENAFGIIYLEAWLYKKPVIGVFEGNVKGVIDYNINGYLIPFYNIRLLAQKIKNLLENHKLKKDNYLGLKCFINN